MGILNIKTVQAGQVDVNPSLIYIFTNDTYATVTTSGYLTEAHQMGQNFSNDQMALVYTSDEGPVWLKVSVSNGVYSLAQLSSPGDVVLPTIADHLIISSDTSGTLANKTGTVINSGSIQAGLDATAGTFISFPGTTASGTLRLAAVDSSSDVAVTISNADHGQASVYSIPDVGAATGQFNVVTGALVDGNVMTASGTAGKLQDSGIASSDVQLNTNIIAAQTADIGGGGAGPITVSVAGLTAGSVVVANIVSSTNTVSVAKVAPGTDDFDITFDADPGAACVVSYVAFVAAQ